MPTIMDKTDDIRINKFQDDTLTFEELQELEKIKKDMLK